MKKLLILAVSFILFAGSAAMAQERSGLGFEYGGGYLMPMNDYDMRSLQSFALTMELTEELSASIFRANGQVRGENSYTGEDGVGDEREYTVINTGDIDITGLKFKHALPMNLPLKAGLEIATARFSNGDHIYRATGGSGAPAAGVGNWGSVDTLDGSYPVLGLLAEMELFSHNTETLTVSAGAGAAYRIIALPELYALGENEAEFASTDDVSEIDAVNNFNNLSITVGLNIGF